MPILVGVVLATFNVLHSSVQAEVNVGDKLPAFSLPGSDGITYESDAIVGKQAMVIAWFPRAFTGGCTKECKALREQGAEIKAFDVAYFTASCDPPQKNMEFAQSLELDYPILSDPERGLAEALGCLSPRGNANRWTYFVGKDGTVLHIDKSVKVAQHGSSIAAKLKELGVDAKNE
ncbi:MAG: redoxin domain-containing protein [Planctomycetota bacterium]